MNKKVSVKALIFMKWHSQRLPKKNIKDLCGEPLFYWIFKSLTESKYVSEIILNTYSTRIKELVLRNFDVTMHERPDYLIEIDENEANRIIEHDIDLVEGEHFIQTHSTNPLLTTQTIDNAIEKYFEVLEEYDSLFSVTPVRDRFYTDNGNGINHSPNDLEKTQNLEPVYKENSCIYLFSKSSFNKHRNRIGERPYLFPTKRYESIDIDTLTDFRIAKAIMTSRLVN